MAPRRGGRRGRPASREAPDPEEPCVICQQPGMLKSDSSNVSDGIAVVREASENVHCDGVASALEGRTSVWLHKKCRANYIRPLKGEQGERYRQAKIEQARARDLRSLGQFDPKQFCVVCGDKADEAQAKKIRIERRGREQVHRVMTFSFRAGLENEILRRNTANVGVEWAEKVKQRLDQLSGMGADLPALEARYHHGCHADFLKGVVVPGGGAPAGRPEGTVDSEKDRAFKLLCADLDSSEECQFSFAEIETMFEKHCNQSLCRTTLKAKLQTHYGDAVSITGGTGERALVNFSGFSKRLLYENWYKERKSREEEEKKRILSLAAQILLEDIRKKPCVVDKYPSVQEMRLSALPDQLCHFLKSLITSKSSDKNKLERKRTALGEVIMYACRPRSYIPPRLLALTIDNHHRHGAREMIDVLNAFGLIPSYSEALRWDANVVALCEGEENGRAEGGEREIGEQRRGGEREAEETPLSFVQYAADNADWNKKGSLDGTNSVHWLGSIRIVTPRPDSETPVHVPRLPLTDFPASSRTNDRYGIPLLHYGKPRANALDKVVLDITAAPSIAPHSSPAAKAAALDIVYLAGRWVGAEKTPSWSGFMTKVLDKDPAYNAKESDIEVLPFIPQEASNYQTLFSAMKYFVQDCDKNGVPSCFVTFDLPLFMKAITIVLNDEQLKPRIRVRLGGFHLLMSYMKAIATLMRGSGLEDLLQEEYGPCTADNIMNGGDYARCLRAFFQVQEALVVLLLDSVYISAATRTEILQLRQSLLDGQTSAEEAMESEAVKGLEAALEEAGASAARRSKTGKLWWTFVKQVKIIRDFVKAERLGLWDEHLAAVRAMMPAFYAAGHILYARAVPLYLQHMEGLPEYLLDGARAGYFTVRRRDGSWSGTWTDMLIEQRLMRPMKIPGGLIGRNFSESVVLKWTMTMSLSIEVSDVVEEISGLHREQSHQHVELRDSRQSLDNKHLRDYISWLRSHSPFLPSDGVRNIATGEVGGPEVNCCDSEEIGHALMEKVHGKLNKQVTIPRKGKVIPLGQLAAKSSNKVQRVDSAALFVEMLKRGTPKEKVRDYLQYELASLPPALFDIERGTMRHNTKSALIKKLNERDIDDSLIDEPVEATPLYNVEADDPGNSLPVRTVVDGGHLLHSTPWPDSCPGRKATYGDVCAAYVKKVTDDYTDDFNNTVVVFDGYDVRWSTKCEEQSRRAASRRICPNIDLDEDAVVRVQREDFLANKKNKSSLISMLRYHLRQAGVKEKQADADADVMIAETALYLNAEGSSVTVIASDTDVLAILISRAGDQCSITMKSTKKGTGYDIRTMRHHIGPMVDVLLFAHAWSGCDTTSAILNKGKATVWNLLKRNENLRRLICCYNEAGTARTTVEDVGVQIMTALFMSKGSRGCLSLLDLRYDKFEMQSLPQLQNFPPTEDATRQHSLRVYLQVQQWLGNDLPPTEWGWRSVDGSLRPVPGLLPPAPEELQQRVSCKCPYGKCKENSKCSCRKVHRTCNYACRPCSEDGCLNTPVGQEQDWDV